MAWRLLPDAHRVAAARTTLVYHHGAGDGVAAGRLRGQIERGGYQVVRMLDAPDDLNGVNRDTTDLVVAAGGDGTISRTASRLAGRDVPLAILPLGTANNIAQTLGVRPGSIEELIAGWKHAVPAPLDVGTARGSFGSMPFLEGAGGGLIPRSIALFDAEPGAKDQPAADKVDRALRRYREVLSKLRPRTWKLTADDEPLTGDYLIVEVLNIRSVGANVVLAPNADPGDGWFDVITVGEEHRAALDAYLAEKIAGRDAVVDLPRRLARRVTTEAWTEMHIDDRLLAGHEIEQATLEIQPAAVQVLR